MRKLPSLTVLIAFAAFITVPVTLFPASKKTVTSLYTQTGFIENKGQIIDQKNKPNPAVLYLLNTPGFNVQLRKAGFSYDVYTASGHKPQDPDPIHLASGYKPQDPLFLLANCINVFDAVTPVLKPEACGFKHEASSLNFHRIDFDLLNANPDCEVITSEPSTYYFNFYTTGTSVNGVKKVRSYNQVTYKNIYPGIDLEFLIDEMRGWKYNFIVHPGGNFENIRIQIKGPDRIIEDSGHLDLYTSQGVLDEVIPGSLEITESDSTQLTFNFKRLYQDIFGFSAAKRIDPKATLVIDPSTMRRWGTYYGSSAFESFHWPSAPFVNDKDGNIIIGGYTMSFFNLATAGAFQDSSGGPPDCFFAKLTTNSQLIWGTYYGGAGFDMLTSIMTDRNANIYVAGSTQNDTIFATPGAHQTDWIGPDFDGFLSKFSPDGFRIWGTYYGGWGNEDQFSVATDKFCNVYLSGQTDSWYNISTPGSWQPVVGGAADAFLAKFDSSGVRLWGTYYGGSSGDFGNACTSDSNGNVFITGFTGSPDNIASPGAYQTTPGGGEDAFLAGFDSTGMLLWGTYYGGSQADVGYGCTIDNNGNILLVGQTKSFPGISSPGSFQPSPGGLYDGFLAKFNFSGQRIWATYYGGTADDIIYNASFGSNGDIFIAGGTQSITAISTPGSFMPVYGGGIDDGFLVKFDSGGVRQWGTYYGGTTYDEAFACSYIHDDTVYLFGLTTSNSNIATANGFQNTYQGGTDTFLTQMIECWPIAALPITGPNSVCTGSSGIVYSTQPLAHAVNYSWTLPPGASIVVGDSTTSITVNFSPGALSGNILVKGFNKCGDSGDSAFLWVTVQSRPVPSINGNDTACRLNSAVYHTQPGMTNYAWAISPGGTITAGGTSSSDSTLVNWNILGNQWIEVNYTDSNGCSAVSPVQKNVWVKQEGPVITTSPLSKIICSDDSTRIILTSAPPANTFNWTATGSGPQITGYSNGTSNLINQKLNNSGLVAGTVTYTITASGNGCPGIPADYVVTVNPVFPVSNLISASQNPSCLGILVTFTATPVNGGNLPLYQWKVNGINVGGNSSMYTYSPVNGDVVICELTSNESCTTGNPASSNQVIMVINSNLPVIVVISASANPVCAGIPVTYTATPTNGGPLPTYQWKVNGVNAGTSNPIYTYTPASGDLVTCILTSSLPCTSNNPSSSNPLSIIINPPPVVTFTACFDTITTVNAKPFKLKGGIPLGGTYSGPGVNPASGIWNPASAGVGNKTITYSYTNAALCSANASRVFKVVAAPAFACGSLLTDVRDIETYQTVQIGAQCWFAESLKYGTEIPDNLVQRDNCIPEKYSRHASPVTRYDFYQWDELMQYDNTPALQGLCPPDWHIPTEAEWMQLFSVYNGPGFAGSQLLSTGFSGFNALVNGSRFQNVSWNFDNFAIHLWSSTSRGPVKAWAHAMNNMPDDHSVSTYPSSRANAFSVRCVKD